MRSYLKNAVPAKAGEVKRLANNSSFFISISYDEKLDTILCL